MTATLAWVHCGDLHLHEGDGWTSFARVRKLVAEVNARIGNRADFLFLPGDNANHGTPRQYRRMIDALAPLGLLWRIIPGDPDFESGDLKAFHAAVPKSNGPETEIVRGHRCMYLDIVSAGARGADFRPTMHDRNRIAERLVRAEAEGEVPTVFMHAYPGDLAADGDAVARSFIDGGVAIVDTGHTHYHELLNDGRVIYAAIRSTGQIEEGGGRPGYAIVCVHDRVPSWRFRELGAAWPHVQIAAPCDVRLVTRPADTHQVPRPGTIAVVAKLLGAGADAAVTPVVDGVSHVAMRHSDGMWLAKIAISEPVVHRIEVVSGDGRDAIDVLVREASALPKRSLVVAPGHACHAIGAWPVAGIEGMQLGPNKNGAGW